MADRLDDVDRVGDVAAATARVISVYLERQPLTTADTVRLCQAIGTTFLALASGVDAAPERPREPAPTPRVDPRQSVFPTHVICLHCGATFRSLFRHLTSAHAQHGDMYRATFGLPPTYPLAAPDVRVGRPAGHHRVSR